MEGAWQELRRLLLQVREPDETATEAHTNITSCSKRAALVTAYYPLHPHKRPGPTCRIVEIEERQVRTVDVDQRRAVTVRHPGGIRSSPNRMSNGAKPVPSSATGFGHERTIR